MENLIYILFIIIVIPLTLLLLLLHRRSKLIVGYTIIGVFSALFIAELNGILLNYFANDVFYVTTTITPVTEEIIKALSVLFYAYVFSDDLEKLMQLSFAVGIGFALFENMVFLLRYSPDMTVSLALIRGISTALMHGVCTAAVGLGISSVRKKKEFFFGGTFALLMLAILYHGIFNILVQSRYPYIGYAIPLITYIPLLIRQSVFFKSKQDPKESTEKAPDDGAAIS